MSRETRDPCAECGRNAMDYQALQCSCAYCTDTLAESSTARQHARRRAGYYWQAFCDDACDEAWHRRARPGGRL